MILCGLAMPTLAQADTPEELAKIYACRAIVDNADRLACFDANVGTLQQAEASGDVVALSRDSVETTRREGFGLDLSGLSRLGGIFGGGGDKADDLTTDADALAKVETNDEGEIKRVTYAVARAASAGNGRYRIELTNGQVWQTIESESLRFGRKKDGEADTITIRRAFAGSFLARVNDKGASVRVRRVK